MTLAAVVAVSSGSAARPQLVPVARGLHSPVYVTGSSSEPRRLYVVEQRGLVRVVAGGRLLPRPFLDVRRLVLHKELAGLLSLAFAPDYRRSRRLYVDYVGRDHDVHVVEYRSAVGSKRSFAGGTLCGISHVSGTRMPRRISAQYAECFSIAWNVNGLFSR